jgi:hypothetical protein
VWFMSREYCLASVCCSRRHAARYGVGGLAIFS